jgi:hypothetical protein
MAEVNSSQPANSVGEGQEIASVGNNTASNNENNANENADNITDPIRLQTSAASVSRSLRQGDIFVAFAVIIFAKFLLDNLIQFAILVGIIIVTETIKVRSFVFRREFCFPSFVCWLYIGKILGTILFKGRL